MTLYRAACFSPEVVGTIANDLLAMRLATTICKPNASFIDVGAHIGSVVSDVHYNNPSAKIIAVEAIPEKAAKLERRFPFATIHNCAAGDSTGEVSFFVNTHHSGYSSLARPASSNGKTIQITVPMKRLDDLVLSNDVDVIKIDVEGAELGVLRGMGDLLERCRPTIMFESGPSSDDSLGFTKEALHEFLKSKSYFILIPNRIAHNDQGLTLEGFLESHLYPRRTTNYFAIAAERRMEIRERARHALGIPETNVKRPAASQG